MTLVEIRGGKCHLRGVPKDGLLGVEVLNSIHLIVLFELVSLHLVLVLLYTVQIVVIVFLFVDILIDLERTCVRVNLEEVFARHAPHSVYGNRKFV